MKTFDEIEQARLQLEGQVDPLLRKKGWKHTSTTPGCLWLWVKTVTWTTLGFPKKGNEWTRTKHERLVMTDRDTALAIQRSLDEDATRSGGPDHG